MRMKKKMILFTVIAILIMNGGIGCEKTDTNAIKTEATIKNIPIEDNCGDYMVLVGNINDVSARWYKPENLSEEYKIDNLFVRITYSLTDKKYNCGFGGYKPIIIIHKIERMKK